MESLYQYSNIYTEGTNRRTDEPLRLIHQFGLLKIYACRSCIWSTIDTHSTAKRTNCGVEARYRPPYCSYSFGGLAPCDQLTFATLTFSYTNGLTSALIVCSGGYAWSFTWKKNKKKINVIESDIRVAISIDRMALIP